MGCYFLLSKGSRACGGGRHTLELVVVHAVLAGEGLDQSRQRRVPPHVVAVPDAALHLLSDVKRPHLWTWLIRTPPALETEAPQVCREQAKAMRC